MSVKIIPYVPVEINPGETLGCLAMFIFIAFILSATIMGLQLDSQCLAAGYPQSQISWTLDRYCIKRVNQTDVVIPLKEIHEK